MKRVIANRYVLHEVLGQGGMGVVYHTYDRLTGHDIALKQVTIALNKGDSADTDNTAAIEQRVALAQEFRVLASLRHPHIISVLDYGFDSDGQPFFTMDLLEDASNLVIFSQSRSYQERLHLTYQMLQALRYLHRRGTLHCDLKPDNVMVIDGQVRLLDFGLALQQQQQLEQKAVGTLAYMSPEVLQRGQFSIASDLYALGIMLYEMFSGTHPYRINDISQLFEDILQHEIDITGLDVEAALQQLIAEMVQKDATERIADIDSVLSRLRDIMGEDAPPETPDMRDSFLQGAQFVGREPE
ncbi:MAG: serine/threonine protein kinase, partial [Aggregatilineales bacterium]